MADEKKLPLDETRADVKAWRAVLAELVNVQGKVFALQGKLPRSYGDDFAPSQVAFDAAMLTGDAWRKLKSLEDRAPTEWEKLEAYEPGERVLDMRFDCPAGRLEAA